MTSPLLIDTDPGCDDALAIALALEDPTLEIVGLTTVHGNTAVKGTTHNARAILEALGRTDVPIAAGADRPLLADLETAEHIHGEGGIRGELPKPTSETEPKGVHAARRIVETARRHDGDLALAAIGPLTNVALALAMEPRLPEMLDDLLVMGGAAFVHGNVTPLAEANFRSDPEAASRVVRDADPTVVGLDVTRRATLPADWIDSLPRESPLARSLRAWLAYYDDEVLERYGMETAAIHDALVIAGLIDGAMVETEAHHMQVGTDSELDRGALVCDPYEVTGGEPNGRVAVDADVERYRELMTEAVEGLV